VLLLFGLENGDSARLIFQLALRARKQINCKKKDFIGISKRLLTEIYSKMASNCELSF
jgi:hypothetical protein